MKPDRQISHPKPSIAKRGFALVITLALMILLTVIAVGLLTLSSVSLRASSQANAMAIAQSNARMALMLAIGELQRSMGPDTRVSANAKILEKSGTSVNDPLEQITGVWEAWRPSPASIGNYDLKKSAAAATITNVAIANGTDLLPQPLGGFHRWLVSTGDLTKAADVTFPKTGTLVNPVELVKSPGTSLPGVQAEKVTLQGASHPLGSMAWAVFDEGQKISASLGKPSTGTSLERLATQDSPAWQNVTAWNKFATLSTADRDKLISYQTSQLAIGNTKDKGGISDLSFSYDLTSYSAGLLTDVTLGKLRTDLSLLFANTTLPADYSTRYLYSGTKDPILPLTQIPTRGNHPHTWPSPDPKWSLLHKFYRIPDDNNFRGYGTNASSIADGSNASITINFNDPASPNYIHDRLTTATPIKKNLEYDDALKLSPVISKAQFFFSLSLCHPDQLTSNIWNKTGGKSGKRINTTVTPNTESPFYLAAAMIIDPVITLWNPYDVPIKVPEFFVYLYRLPLQFKFDVISSGPVVWRMDPSKSPWSKFSDMISNTPSAGTDTALAYPLHIMPLTGTYIEMFPGEHIVCSAHRKITGSNDIGSATTTSTTIVDSGSNIILQPGWFAPNPGGTSTSALLTAGGIGTQNLCKDGIVANGTSQFQNYTNGTPNGTWSVTQGIPLRIGDKLGITVGPYSRTTSTFLTLNNAPVDFYIRYGKCKNNGKPIDANHEFVNEPDFGAIELQYISNLKTFSSSFSGPLSLPYYDYTMTDLSLSGFSPPYNTYKFYTGLDAATNQYWGAKMKKPFCVATLHLKSVVGIDTDRNHFPSRAWINNNPAAIYASNGLGNQLEDQASHQYEFSLEKLNGSWMNGVPDVTLNTTTGRYDGYGGPSPGATYGRPCAPFISIPRVHATSLAQLRSAPLNQSGKLPLQAQVLANSFAHPLMSADAVIDSTKGYLDHSFLANNLFDRTFFSSAKTGQGIIDLATSGTALINSRMISYGTPNSTLLTGSKNHDHSAASLLVNGAFNVNSTSENAWKAFLTAMNGASIPVLASLKDTTLGTVANTAQEAHVSRFTTPMAQRLGDELDATSGTTKPAWNGYRKLDQTQIASLAKFIVEEVKKRGPFQSLAEFINRRAEKSTLGQMGALQAAIEQSGINDASINDTNSPALTGTETGSTSYVNTDAAKGSPLTGTPGYVLQGDLLNSMAPFIAVRSDTFKIRTYGEALDPTGTKVTAVAWCEAIVQRVPDYVDSTTNAASDHLGTDSPTVLTAVNKTFGRRFQLVSFRWLNQQEL